MSGAIDLQPATRGSLLPAWLRGGRPEARPAPVHAPAAPDARQIARRQQFEDIGDLLFTHDLDLTPHNFRVAQEQLSGNPHVNAAIAQLLRDNGRLTDEMLARIDVGQAEGIRPEVLSDVAGALAGRLAEVLAIVGHSRDSARNYGEALDRQMQSAGDDPVGTLHRLMLMTRDVVEATRTMEEQLDDARRETDKLRAKVQSARRDAERDHLTGLPNRRWFDARLAMLAGGSAVIALCDIDDFKAVNDGHGHDAGDRVLTFVARLLKTELGGRAEVARYGGEEFVCLFEDATPQEARDLLDDVRVRLAKRSLVNQDTGTPIPTLTFSAGLASVADDVRASLRAADRALYEAKRLGKDRILIAG